MKSINGGEHQLHHLKYEHVGSSSPSAHDEYMIKREQFESFDTAASNHDEMLIFSSQANQLAETDETSSIQANATNKRGSLQLWQFLLHLLSTKAPPHAEPIIEWTRKSAAEFKLLDPEEVARLWGVQKNRPTMNYDKLSRSLRYYYEKGTSYQIQALQKRYKISSIGH